MRKALTQATLRNLSSFKLASDSKEPINLINNNSFYLEIYGITQDIISPDLDVNFVYVPRYKNEEADQLAKAALCDIPTGTGLQPV